MFTGLLFAACSAAALAGETPHLDFPEMYVRPVGPRGFQQTPKLASLDGHPVRMAGYMVHREVALPGSFLLAPLPARLGDEDDGLADDLPATVVTVRFPPELAASVAPYRDGRIAVTGTLCLGPEREADGRISSVRLMLDAGTATPFFTDSNSPRSR